MNIVELLKEMAAAATNIILRNSGDEWECICRMSESQVYSARRDGLVMAVMDCYKQFLEDQILEKRNGNN